MIIYRGIYTDVETDDNNNNIQVEKRIDIIDLQSNPFNISYSTQINVINQTVTFTFDPLPANAIGVSIGYTADGGVTWAQQTVGTSSPIVIDIPLGNYTFYFDIQTTTGNIFYSFEDQVIELEMAGTPVNDIVIDNAEDKFTPIRARQLAIQIFSSNQISINTFSEGPDDRFKVEWYIDDVLHFAGFLSMGDLEQEFLPDPNIITLTAVDGLGFLNDIPLTDFDGNTPEYENKILEYLLWSLSKTGLQLNLKASFNIREASAVSLNTDTTGEGHFFEYSYLDAKTFEAEVGECENCYDVISKILGKEAFLFQYLGEWNIVRVDEVEHGLSSFTFFSWRWDGVQQGKTTATNTANVGEGEAYSWMNDDAVMSNQRLTKEIRLAYKFETPEEVPCNIDFNRGNPSTSGSLTGYSLFDIDCWTTSRDFGSNETAPNTTAHIARAYDANGYEIDKFVVILRPSSATNPPTYIRSGGIPVEAKDKFTFSMDYSAVEDNDNNENFMLGIGLIVLYANDGTVWTLDCFTGNEPNWNQSDPEISIFRREIEWDLRPSEQDLTEWVTFSIECNQIPKAGNVVIYLYAANRVSSASDNFDIRYNNVSFEYLPYTNGTYQKYIGQETKVKQDISTRNIIEEDVFISDSPHRIFKGALLTIAGYTEIYSGSAIFGSVNSVTIPGYVAGKFSKNMRVVISGSASNNITAKITSVDYAITPGDTVLTFDVSTQTEIAADIDIELTNFGLAGLFYNAAQEPDGPVFQKKYGEIQAFDFWNQVNRTMVKFEGTIDRSDPPPALGMKWFLTDTNENTNNRIFLLLHYEYDSYLCEWSAFFFECSNSQISKSYTGNSFKYLTNE